MNEKVLEVKNLRVSFKTNNGTVKAVRGINFSLYKGKTLAIVGESGSGKSVTSRAVLGILAGNRIIEDGQILYDGKDILRLNEEELTKIRGSKISMIFQDPMSSLNPIMKVGKQVTEAMILKQKSVIRDAKHVSKLRLERLHEQAKKDNMASEEEIKKLFADLHAASIEQKEFNNELLTKIAVALMQANHDEISANKKEAIEVLKKMKDEIFVNGYDKKLLSSKIHELNELMKKCNDVLLERKDDLTTTFVSSIKHYVNDHELSLKQAIAVKKLIAKKDKKRAKGKIVEDATIKERAFGSELNRSSDFVENLIKGLFDELISAYEAFETSKSFDAKDAAKKMLEYLKENIYLSSLKVDKAAIRQKAIDVLGEVGIPEPEKRIEQYPFQFSGGMRQRIVIAIALSSNPEVLICDEPTTALDVTIQAQILELINKLKEERGLSVIFVTHDLGVVANMADDIAVMYAGKIVEYGTVDEIFYDPRHPYTWALLASMPDLETKEKLDAIPGTPPNMIIPPKGDAFAARNKYAMKIDLEQEPPLFPVSDTHFAATWLLHENAPKVQPPRVVVERIKRMQIVGGASSEKK